jgi:dimethylamine monooxygenase subunit A
MRPALYLPFAEGQWQLKMGLRSLDLDSWIEIDDTFLPYLARKQDLLAAHYTDLYAAVPGSEAGQQEVLALLLEYLPKRFPTHYQREIGGITNLVAGERWQVAEWGDRPLDLAGRLVQEDLCLMLPSQSGYILGAASLCFPLYWRLQEKLGQPIGQIHAPVPDYTAKLARPVDGFFDRLQPQSPGYRFNWSIVDTPELFLGLHRQHQMADSISAEQAGEQLWIRVERQTLRRLPQSHAVLFTVRTYVYPLSILAQHPQAARGLQMAIAQIPPQMQLYKSINPIRAALDGYLSQIAGI